MHAFLISAGTKEKRGEWVRKKLEEMDVSTFDCVKLVSDEGKHIGVSDVRTFTKHLTLAPSYGTFLAGVIEDAQLLTTEAQNALLKTLEEPSPHSMLILETVNAELLLPTILSRCLIQHLGSGDVTKEDRAACQKTIDQLLAAKTGDRMKLIDTIVTDREITKAWIDLALSATRQSLLSLTNPKQTTILLRRLLLAQKYLAANVTPKLVLDTIFA